MNYKQQLKTSAWLRRKYDILERDNYVCSKCMCDNYERPLHVHHIAYLKGKKAWEYPDYLLVTLCEECHENEHKELNTTNPNKIQQWITELLLKWKRTDSQ